jgi:hypothetical protein
MVRPCWSHSLNGTFTFPQRRARDHMAGHFWNWSQVCDPVKIRQLVSGNWNQVTPNVCVARVYITLVDLCTHTQRGRERERERGKYYPHQAIEGTLARASQPGHALRTAGINSMEPRRKSSSSVTVCQCQERSATNIQ